MATTMGTRVHQILGRVVELPGFVIWGMFFVFVLFVALLIKFKTTMKNVNLPIVIDDFVDLETTNKIEDNMFDCPWIRI